MIDYFIVFLLIFYPLAILFEKKGNKIEHFFQSLICLAISVILLLLAIPSSFGVRTHGFLGKKCYSFQKTLISAIEQYDQESNSSFPKNCNKDEFIKNINELLVKNNYLKEDLIKSISMGCIYELKDNVIYCDQHGNCNKGKSSNHAIFKDEKTAMILQFIVILLGIIASIKFFIFFLSLKNK